MSENDFDTRKQIAATILEQLGGRRFLMFTGAKNLMSLDSGLQFSFPKRGKDGSNKWRIILTPADTYTVETYWVRDGVVKLVETFTDIYNDSLVELFERQTGLATHF